MAEQSYYAECRAPGEVEGEGPQMAVTMTHVSDRATFPPILTWPCIRGVDCPHQGHHELRRVSADELAELMPEIDADEVGPDAMRWTPGDQVGP